ncbi:SRPBCC domain-containing protein [Salinicoccus sp. ID82-1]|uniref:SRPBCC domain-containing protein n=1 Tax=Salinicoccus sp. ID82-1 TaxID=2820269 RepID=UPI001F36BAA2|nr:SRPBCC domain-containing protein [Salinicoccus sp. ID82-1]MCG1010731.1 SRPBCC domain-containing protein [Salinicoccus sp. ID82-1]
MDVSYHKDERNVYQTIREVIAASPQHVFSYLGTEGISQWFEELSFSETESGKKLIFDLGDGTFEEMEVLVYEMPGRIGFTWDVGEVYFTLEPADNETELKLEQRLPFEFGHIAQDFTGWQFQVKNLKHISETGQQATFDDEAFKEQMRMTSETLELD